MTILYFTSTGNCLQLAKEIGGTQLSIPQMIKEERYHFSDDAIGLVFPVYGLGMPKIVKRFLEKARFDAKYTFSVATYGGFPGASLDSVTTFGSNYGISFDYMAQLLCVDNYLPMFDMEKAVAKVSKSEHQTNMKQIVSEINNRTTNSISSPVHYKIATKIAQTFFGFMFNDKKAQSFIVDSSCNNCGTCAEVCPTANITVDGNVSFSDRCENCFACIHNCPSSALRLKKEKGSARYRNETVTLREIIEANSQQ